MNCDAVFKSVEHLYPPDNYTRYAWESRHPSERRIGWYLLAKLSVALEGHGNIGLYPLAVELWLNPRGKTLAQLPLRALIDCIAMYLLPSDMLKVVPRVVKVLRDAGEYEQWQYLTAPLVIQLKQATQPER